MTYCVLVYSHPHYTGHIHRLAVHSAVTAVRLTEVITGALEGRGVRVVVEEELDERPRSSREGTCLA